jgi:hypothetical protein
MTAETDASVTSFKDRNRALQELVRELALLRAHNLKFKEGDDPSTLLLFAEGAIVIVIIEHFVRMVLGDRATDRDTLNNLLEKAVADRLLRLPWDDQAEGIREVVGVRNTILHGNYAQAAREAQCSSVEDYFKRQFAPEVEGMFKIADYLVTQIDPETGRPYANPAG